MPDHDPTRADSATELMRKRRPGSLHGLRRCSLSSGEIVRSRPGAAPCGHRQIRAAVIAGQSLLSLLHRAADVRVHGEFRRMTGRDVHAKKTTRMIRSGPSMHDKCLSGMFGTLVVQALMDRVPAVRTPEGLESS
jgi:hypothetical protein